MSGVANTAGKILGDVAKHFVSQSDTPSTPPEQTKLEQEQLDALDQQQSLIKGFMPFVLQQNGLVDTNTLSDADRQALKPQLAKAQKDLAYWQKLDNSDPTKAHGLQYTQDAIGRLNDQINPKYDYTPEQKASNAQLQTLQQQSLDLAKAQNQRAQDAINGKIGPSDALMHQEGLDFSALKEDQGRLGNEIIGDNLENATAKSTSGIQALEGLRQTYGSLKSNEIQNIIAGGPALSAGYTANYRGAANNSANTAQNQILSPLGALSSQYGGAMQPYEYQTGLVNSNNQFNAGATNSFTNSLLTGLIQAGGAAAKAYAGA